MSPDSAQKQFFRLPVNQDSNNKPGIKLNNVDSPGDCGHTEYQTGTVVNECSIIIFLKEINGIERIAKKTVN